MTDSVQAGATLLLEPQQQPSTPINAALQRIDCFASRIPVKSRTTAAPPGSPTEGDRYLIPTGATGDWSGHDGQIAAYLSGWKYFTPKEGWSTRIDDEDTTFEFDGTAWLLSGMADHKQWARIVDTDFDNLAFGLPLTFVASGTGAAGTAGAPEAGRPGIFEWTTGTTNAGLAALYGPSTILAGGVGSILLGGATWYQRWGVKIHTLSTGSERYVVVFGFHDNAAGTPTDGVWLEYDEATSANWRICAASNTTTTKTTTSVAVDTNFHTYEVVINAAGTSAEFFRDGVSMGTVTTNIPVGAGRDTGIVAKITKTVGTTGRLISWDELAIYGKLTTKRP